MAFRWEEHWLNGMAEMRVLSELINGVLYGVNALIGRNRVQDVDCVRLGGRQPKSAVHTRPTALM